jgi:hypothetical protein
MIFTNCTYLFQRSRINLSQEWKMDRSSLIPKLLEKDQLFGKDGKR